jgi:general secretion pathway protein G
MPNLLKASLLGMLICCLVGGTLGCRKKGRDDDGVPEEGTGEIDEVNDVDDARVKHVTVQIVNMKAALDMFKLDMGRYPTQQEGLMALIEPPSEERAARLWRGPYLKDDMFPLDPWGNVYVYRLSEDPDTGVERVEIISYGKDGVRGGEGCNADISSQDLSR